MHGWGGNRYDQRKISPLIILIIGIVVLSALRFPWWGWMLFFMFGMPMIMRAVNSFGGSMNHRGNGHRHYASPRAHTPWDHVPHREKRKNGYYPQSVDDIDDMLDEMDGRYAGEKPKRRPVYVVGDDGELVEMTDESLAEQQKAKRTKGNEDGYEYV